MTNDLINRRLLPKQAIIVYSDKGDYGNEYYLESRQIVPQKNGYSFLAPQPLSKAAIKGIASSFMQRNNHEMNFAGIIPDHLLLAVNRPGTSAVIWYRPAMQRDLNFSERLGIKGKPKVKVPATLYMVLNTTLYVFALQSNVRPREATRLFHAPFFNIYADGNVCLGSAPVGRVKSKTFEGEAERFERGFYMAEQNGGTSKPCKTDLRTLWTKLIKAKAEFPVKAELIQHPKYKTLGDLISKFIPNSNYGTSKTPVLEEDFEDDLEALEAYAEE